MKRQIMIITDEGHRELYDPEDDEHYLALLEAVRETNKHRKEQHNYYSHRVRLVDIHYIIMGMLEGENKYDTRNYTYSETKRPSTKTENEDS